MWGSLFSGAVKLRNTPVTVTVYTLLSVCRSVTHRKERLRRIRKIEITNLFQQHPLSEY